MLSKRLEGVKLREPCQLFKSNERNKKRRTKVDYILLFIKTQAFVGYCSLRQVQTCKLKIND